MIERFYRQVDAELESCFYVELSAPLSAEQQRALSWLLAETFEPERFGRESFLSRAGAEVVEVGPRLNFETAFSTNAKAICRACGLLQVTRLERSRRYVVPAGTDRQRFATERHDRMTECEYPRPLETFDTGLEPTPVRRVPLLAGGVEALRQINREMGLGMDEWDVEFYHRLFVERFRRDPTNVECFQLAQANSEHSRHWFFKGRLVVDGSALDKTLLDRVRATLQAHPSNSIIAFRDNSSGMRGYTIDTLLPVDPRRPSPFAGRGVEYDVIFTAETHNFPSGVAPFPGAETGTGGRIRDVHATGAGALVLAGTAGYGVGSLNLPDFPIPGEDPSFAYPGNLASPRQILIEESNGASDYGNKFGEPVIQGFVRSFGQRLSDGERREWIKPIMFTGGVGQIDHRHIAKGRPERGMKIIQVGGPAYRIGIGGGAASSMIQGENKEELDFSAVQRGDAEMEQKLNRVIRACVELGDANPIVSIHDQGAGGPCNVITELVEPAGGRIEIRRVNVGDRSLSVLEIWGAEYQERSALLVRSERLAEFEALCVREQVPCEVLGDVTGDGRIVVHDERDDSTPVDLDLAPILGNIPQKTFALERVAARRAPLGLPKDLTLAEAVRQVFLLPAVGSKGYLVRKVDRSVTGLIARQQCAGPRQLTVSDVSVIAQSHFSRTGAAIAIGEQPIKGLVNPAAGARMSVAEALTNLVWARISSLGDIKASVNWMWAAKLPGEGAALADAVAALSDLMISLGIAADGGKDSLSMAARVGDEVVKAPGQVVVSAYATVPDITRVVTPDVKAAGASLLLLIDLARGKRRLGGSALAQVCGQVGDDAPDVDDAGLLGRGFQAVQELIERRLVLAGHDVSDGGLVTTLAEMVMPVGCGLTVAVPVRVEPMATLFAEELGLVIEVADEAVAEVNAVLARLDVPWREVARTTCDGRFVVAQGKGTLLEVETDTLLAWWEATSDRLELEQTSRECALALPRSHARPGPKYQLTYKPVATSSAALADKDKPKIAILREEGTNGDREMASAFHLAGFETWDVSVADLLAGSITLDRFRGIAFPGGFSYADVLDSSKGQAGIIRFNPRLRAMFDAFRERPDTFSLGICNGCQLSALLGWVPGTGVNDVEQPRFVRNSSGRLESRWVTVKIAESPAVLLSGMAGSTIGVWVNHGEGRLHCRSEAVLDGIVTQQLVPAYFVDDENRVTEQYPFNPNGAARGIAGLCSLDGRHLALMPHPERSFLPWQCAWLPTAWRETLTVSPWMKLFQNARAWCDETR
jgi:phosphoribosylformylglycinamidine synthase